MKGMFVAVCLPKCRAGLPFSFVFLLVGTAVEPMIWAVA